MNRETITVSRTSTNRVSALVQFALITAVLLVLFGIPLRALFELSRSHDDYSHTLLIPVVSAVLVYWDRQRIFEQEKNSGQAKSSRLLSAVLAGAATLTYFGARQSELLTAPDTALAASIALLVVLWIAGFSFVFGATATRRAVFPLLFLAFMVPLPTAILDPVITFLQHGSAEITAWMFQLSGVPVHREGLIFYLPGQAIEIAKECSGLRSSIALLLTTLLSSYLYLRSNVSRAVLILLTVPLAIFKNGLRITTLTLLAIRVDPGFLSGRLHNQGGFVFFLITLAVVGLGLKFLQDWENRQPSIAVART